MYRQLYGDEVANSIELGDEMEFPKPTEVLGRIAAQTAKQVIFRRSARPSGRTFSREYNQRVGEVVNGTVKRFENGDIIVEIGRIEAVLPRKEQSRAESYTPGDRVRDRDQRRESQRQGTADRAVAHRPGAADQAVRAGSAGDLRRHRGDSRRRARGGRSRQGGRVLARARRRSGRRVRRHEGHARAVDHPRAARREDRHRRVVGGSDRVRHQRAQPGEGAARARSSTTASSVMEVVVEDKQLSLAIGKKGQNVRLAAKLTGWRIDIKSEEEKRREVEAQFEGLEAGGRSGRRRGRAAGRSGRRRRRVPYTLAGIGEKTVRKLVDGGFDRVEALAAATVEQLSEIPGIGEKTAEKILAAARGEANRPRRPHRREGAVRS